MRKRVGVIIFAAIVLAVLLFPVRTQLRDGGSVVYTSLTYRVTFLHRLAPGGEGEPAKFITGPEIELFPFLFR